MGTQRDHLTEITAERAEAPRDPVAHGDDIQPAVARPPIADLGDAEEFI